MDEEIYECEVKKLFLRDGTKKWEWVRTAVAEAIAGDITQFRCKDCHGAVRLHGRHVLHPRWSPQKRTMVDGLKPANGTDPGQGCFTPPRDVAASVDLRS